MNILTGDRFTYPVKHNPPPQSDQFARILQMLHSIEKHFDATEPSVIKDGTNIVNSKKHNVSFLFLNWNKRGSHFSYHKYYLW